jgi:hypothetical protein
MRRLCPKEVEVFRAANARDDEVQLVTTSGSTLASARHRKSACFGLLRSMTTRLRGAIRFCGTSTILSPSNTALSEIELTRTSRGFSSVRPIVNGTELKWTRVLSLKT